MNTNSPEVREIVKRAFPNYNGRRITVEPFKGPINLASYWDSGHRDYYTLVSLLPDNNLAAAIPENGSPFTPAIKPLESLPINGALVRHSYSRQFESVCIYVNAESLAKLLPSAVELTQDEKIVLAATCAYKSSYAGVKNYRFYQAVENTSITLDEWNSAKASCMARGLLNKAGAITDDGRNAIGNIRLDRLRKIDIKF